MGSLRNPIGPLPSSIYWRRRVVALALVAVLVALLAWVFSSGGDEGGKTAADGKGPTPAPTISAGPDPSGPAISQQPGGRDESGGGSGGSGSGGGAGGEGPDASGSPGTPGAGDGSGGGTGGSGDAPGQQVPASSPLPSCAPSALKLTLRTTEVSYAPGEKPSFELVATNTSAADCKADFGPKAAVLTVSDAEDEDVWSSEDCPRTAPPRLLRVPAGGTITHTVTWDLRRSSDRCATPEAGTAGPGTYLVEAVFPGVKVLPASFRLEQD
ncbi:hypothetical protein NPS70_24785 [Streptomyces sp. C10-9-1]|uniref:hypothetical protein n=1 Tax=Streptomyces sp. C10-9-1 TaxID=1859285 RepID=UPI002111DC5F|nr:hypothetical protein [Streptomyces sp. C10-9-1]MCQ6556373.1 hypothetical protein [Streptomyces sp. C10-9-1]